MGSSGSSAGSLRRSNQSSRTGLPGAGLGGAGCCADAVSGKAAAAPPRKAMNSRLFIVASLSIAVTGFKLVPRRRTEQWLLRPRGFGMLRLHLVVKTTPQVDVRKGASIDVGISPYA